MQDILVLMQEPVPPLSFLRAKPIGAMRMIDCGEEDDKIIAGVSFLFPAFAPCCTVANLGLRALFLGPEREEHAMPMDEHFAHTR